MAISIEAWLGRQFQAVDEDGSAVRRVRLVAGDGGMTWEIWDGPFQPVQAAKIAAEMEEVLSSLAEEWPNRPVQVLLVAEDARGDERARHPKTIRGKQKSANPGLMGGESSHLASSFEAQAQTMKNILGSANSQLEVQRMALKDLSESNVELMKLIRVQKENEILTMETSRDNMTKLTDAATEQLPALLELAKMIASKDKKGLADVASQAAQTVLKKGTPPGTTLS